MKWLVKLVCNILFCKIFYRVKYINKEIEEKFDKCIICPNHSNTLEPTWLYAKTNNLCIMAKSELFENKILSKLYKYFEVFPIRRGEHDIRSILHAVNLFKDTDKKKLLIFPEGERVSKDIKKGVAKVGAVYIAAKADIPIIPVHITKNAKLFSRVDIIYGNAIFVSQDIIKDKVKLNQITKDLLDTIYKI